MSRDAILQRVRAALADVPDLDPAEDTPVAWAYAQPTGITDILDRFVDRIEDYKARLVRVAPDAVPSAVAEALAECGVRSVVLPAAIPPSWSAAIKARGIVVLTDDPPLSNAELDAAESVVTACAVAAAETGTIVLDHLPDQGRRALSLVPDVHVCVVRSDQVVTDVPEVVARLADAVRAGRPQTWISGGSATSDIELSRVEGVHGPRTLFVVLVD